MRKGSRLSLCVHFESVGFFAALLAVPLVLGAPFVAAEKKDKAAARAAMGRLPVQNLTEDEAILHAT